MKESTQYKNPPVREAVCQINFSDDSIWDLSIPGILYEKIRDVFSEKDNVIEGSVNFKIEAKKNSEPVMQHSQVEYPRFLTKDKNVFVILKKNSVSVHCINKYIGWEEFISKIRFIFDNYIDVASPRFIKRIGLRYVNEMSFEKNEFILSENFVFRPSILCDEKKLIAVQSGIVSQLENNNYSMIQLNNIDNSNITKISFILDIDHFTVDFGDYDKEKINSWLDNAHKYIEEKFEESLTEKLKKNFN